MYIHIIRYYTMLVCMHEFVKCPYTQEYTHIYIHMYVYLNVLSDMHF